MADAMPKPGEVIAGKYRVERMLGQGGMGAVYAALHTVTGKRVAIKWLLPDLAESSEAVERFLREAQVAAHVQHPNVVDIYDVGTEQGAHFLVMEYLRGMSLADALEKKQLSQPALIYVLCEAMQGVSAAHAAQITHRDLKPDNIFLCIDDNQRVREVKVLDFGIAKLAPTEALSSLTRTGMAFGTPHYMSAEQLRGDKTVDHRADQYAFGVMLYLVLSGQMPYDADTLGALAMRVALENPPELSWLVPDIDPNLARAVMRALQRDREDRFPNLDGLRDAISPYAGTDAWLGSSGIAADERGKITPSQPIRISGNTPAHNLASAPTAEQSSIPGSNAPAATALLGSTRPALDARALADTGTRLNGKKRLRFAALGAASVAGAALVIWTVAKKPGDELNTAQPSPVGVTQKEPAGAASPDLPAQSPVASVPAPALGADSGPEGAQDRPVAGEIPLQKPASAERPRERHHHGKIAEGAHVEEPVIPAPVAASSEASETPRAPSEVRPEVKRVGKIDVEEF
jgi:serine/threonine protein kinase